MGQLRVLVTDDSPTARQLLVHIIKSAPDMELVGEAKDGCEAVQLACEVHPNVILMDLTMPKMDGLEATREIMRLAPTPIIVVSASLEGREAEIAFQSMRAGALTVIPKPIGMRDPKYMAMSGGLLNAIRAMAGVRVIRHWKRQDASPKPKSVELASPNETSHEIVAIAASTGGPAALSEIIRALPADFPLPVVIVQHMAADFYTPLVTWLAKLTPLRVALAQQGEQPFPGTIYFASGEGQLRLSKHRRFEIDTRPGTAAFTPCGDILLESVARAYGTQAIGMVLTGMGDDGARGLRAMRDAGASTIAQDEATSVVFGMPREAIALGGAQKILALPDIPNELLSLVKVTTQ